MKFEIDFLNRKKQYRDLDDIYKTSRFLQLYLKMYEYILSIPKDKIVVKGINKYNDYAGVLINYIHCFLKSDFYHWRERLYKLMTEKHEATSFKTYELLYGQRAREFFDEYLEKRQKSCVKTNLERYGVENPSQFEEVKEKKKQTSMKHYGVEYPFQSEEVKEKYRSTSMKHYGVENPMQCEEVRERIKQTNIERHGVDHYSKTEEFKEKFRNTSIKRYGVEHPSQSEEVRERTKRTNIERHGVENPFQSEEVKEKIKQTNLERHGCEYGFQTSEYTNHSRIADEFCMELYTKLPEDIKSYCIFFKKSNKEYMLEDNGKFFKYDFTIFSESIKVIVEFDGLYWHGLKKDQKFVKGIPVEEIWEMDKEKQRLAEMNGFKVIRVREDEYLKNKEEILNNIINLIMK